MRDVDPIHHHSVLGPIISHHYTDLPVVTTIHGELNGELRDIYERVAPKVSVIAVSHAQRKPAPDLRVARVIHPGTHAKDFPVGNGGGSLPAFLSRPSPDNGAGPPPHLA